MNILLAVDVQSEFNNDNEHHLRIIDYIRRAKENGYDRVYATVCGNSPGGSFVRYSNWTDLIGGAKPLEFDADRVYYKDVYGLREREYLDMGRDNMFTVIGYNTGACVMKVCLDLFDLEFDFCILKDYCYSSDGAVAHYRGLSMLYNLIPNAVK